MPGNNASSALRDALPQERCVVFVCNTAIYKVKQFSIIINDMAEGAKSFIISEKTLTRVHCKKPTLKKQSVFMKTSSL